jgi:hypothetical protein
VHPIIAWFAIMERKKAIVGMRHPMIVIDYHILKNKVTYYELGDEYLDQLK